MVRSYEKGTKMLQNKLRKTLGYEVTKLRDSNATYRDNLLWRIAMHYASGDVGVKWPSGTWRHPASLWLHWEVWQYHRSIDKWKGYKLRKRYEGTKKIRKMYEVTKKVRSYEKDTKLSKRYEVTKKVRRCYEISYEKPWLWSYQVTR